MNWQSHKDVILTVVCKPLKLVDQLVIGDGRKILRVGSQHSDSSTVLRIDSGNLRTKDFGGAEHRHFRDRFISGYTRLTECRTQLFKEFTYDRIYGLEFLGGVNKNMRLRDRSLD